MFFPGNISVTKIQLYCGESDQPGECESVKDDVLVEVDGPDDALPGVVLQDGSGEVGPDLLQVPDSVSLQSLLVRQLCVVNIWML